MHVEGRQRVLLRGGREAPSVRAARIIRRRDGPEQAGRVERVLLRVLTAAAAPRVVLGQRHVTGKFAPQHDALELRDALFERGVAVEREARAVEQRRLGRPPRRRRRQRDGQAERAPRVGRPEPAVAAGRRAVEIPVC